MVAVSLIMMVLIANSYIFHTLLPIFKSLFLIVTIWLIGLFIEKGDHHESFLETFAKGLLITIAFFFLMSSLKLINPTTIILYLILPYIALPLKRASVFKVSKHLSQQFLKRDHFEYLIFIIPLLYAILPSTFYDTLVYHLGLPNFIIQHGGFVSAPEFMFYNMFIYYEIALIPALYLGDFVPRLFHFFTGVLFILSVLDFAGHYFELKKRRIFLLTTLTLPLSLFLLTTVKADLVSAMFIFIAIKKYIDKQRIWSALFWGTAIGVKVFSGLAFGLFFLIVTLRNPVSTMWLHLRIGIIAFLTVLPLLIKNVLIIGNPVFPFLSHLFTTLYWDHSRYLLVRSEVGSSYQSLMDLLKAPYRFSFQMQGAGGMVGPIFLVFLPFLAFFKRYKHQFLLYFSLLLLFSAPLFGQAFRYIYIVFILLSIFVALSYQLNDSKFLKIVFGILIVYNSIYGLFTLESIYSARKLYFEKQSIEQYRLHYYPSYRGFSTINRITPPSSKILVAGESRGYLLKRRHMIASPYDYSIMDKYIVHSSNRKQFFERIKADGFDYLFFNLAEFKRLQSYRRLSPEKTEILFDYLKSTPPFRKEGPLYIYKL